MQDPNPEVHDVWPAPTSTRRRSPRRNGACSGSSKLVTEHAYRTTDEDVESLRALGWTDPQIAECVYITALFAFFNRVADAFGIEEP